MFYNKRFFSLFLIAVICCFFCNPNESTGTYQCDGFTDDCLCGISNPYPCCDNTGDSDWNDNNDGNCTWWAWHMACCRWDEGLPGFGNAEDWLRNAQGAGYLTGTTPKVGSIFVWKGSDGKDSSEPGDTDDLGHVGWVFKIVSDTIYTTEMNCGFWNQYTNESGTPNVDQGYKTRSASWAHGYIYYDYKIPITGDWNGNGIDTFGRYYDSTFHLDNGQNIGFGIPGDIPVIGDWDCDGDDNIGIFRPLDSGTGESMFYLDTNNNGTADCSIPFGVYPEDIPIAGDWDGDGCDDIGGYWPPSSTFYLYTLSGCTKYHYIDVPFGMTGDTPITGDWDCDLDDDVGIFRPQCPNSNTNCFYLDLDLTGDQHEKGPYELGDINDVPTAGDWDGEGNDNIGVYRSSNDTFYTTDIPDDCCECTSGPCCDGCNYKSSGSQPTDYTDYYDCNGSNSPSGTNYVRFNNYYCNGIDSAYHLSQSTSDTCGICEYCTEGDSTCNYYSTSTICSSTDFCSDDDLCDGYMCNGSGSCSVPYGCSDCGDKDCDYLDDYFCSGAASPTGTNYTIYRDYTDCNRPCSSASCQDCSCTSYSENQVAACDVCRYCEGSGCANYSAGEDCGICSECNGAGACSNLPADDSECGVIDCDGLDTECRDYHDLISNRCEGLGDCKDANTTDDCTNYTNEPYGTPCTGGICDGNGNCDSGVDCDCDVNGDGSITPQDALCAFQKYLGICPTACGPCEEVCCDVNQDNNCTPGDALCIFQEYLGIGCEYCN